MYTCIHICTHTYIYMEGPRSCSQNSTQNSTFFLVPRRWCICKLCRAQQRPPQNFKAPKSVNQTSTQIYQNMLQISHQDPHRTNIVAKSPMFMSHKGPPRTNYVAIPLLILEGPWNQVFGTSILLFRNPKPRTNKPVENVLFLMMNQKNSRKKQPNVGELMPASY